MIKKIILGISILFTTSIFAQEGTASPYSFYGIGDVRFKGTAENRAMGGLGVMADSVRVNLQNPASYSFLKYTSLSLGGTNKRTNFKTNEQSEDAQRTTLDYLAIGFPVGSSAGVSFGLVPFSSVGYKIADYPNDVSDSYRFYTGKGGLNKVYVGGAYEFMDNISLGVDVQYNFGKIDRESVVFFPNVILGSRTRNTSVYSGFSFVFGLMHQQKINTKWDWSNSISFSPKSKIVSNNSRNIALVTYNISGTEIVSNEEDIPVIDSRYELPSKFSFGSSFGMVKKWMVGAEVTFQGKTKDENQELGVTYRNSASFSLGGYYVPKYNSFSGYFKRMTYRAGYRFEDTGLQLNDKNIVSHTGSIGFGFPVGTSISSINLGLEYGKRGTRANGLIEENYFGISLGLTFSDRWFVKTKYD